MHTRVCRLYGQNDLRIETEEVTEDTARSASEEFETSVSGEAGNDDNDGLSNFEKALLIGLGAVVAGSVLDNGDEIVTNSGDRVVLRDDSSAYISGHPVFCPEPVLVHIHGSSWGGSSFRRSPWAPVTTYTRPVSRR